MGNCHNYELKLIQQMRNSSVLVHHFGNVSFLNNHSLESKQSPFIAWHLYPRGRVWWTCKQALCFEVEMGMRVDSRHHICVLAVGLHNRIPVQKCEWLFARLCHLYFCFQLHQLWKKNQNQPEIYTVKGVRVWTPLRMCWFMSIMWISR